MYKKIRESKIAPSPSFIFSIINTWPSLYYKGVERPLPDYFEAKSFSVHVNIKSLLNGKYYVIFFLHCYQVKPKINSVLIQKSLRAELRCPRYLDFVLKPF